MKHNVCNKFVRICYNTKDWRYPSGDASDLEMKGSFANTHGYGSEEWLFRYEWMLSGYDGDDTRYRYSFVQPLSRYPGTYEDNELSIILWTFDDQHRRWIVGKIDKVYVPLPDEIEWAQNQFVKNGWFDTMCKELRDIKVQTAATRPSLNIRFTQENVTLFDPWIDATGSKLTIADNARYGPYDYGPNDLKIVESLRVAQSKFDPTRTGGKGERKGYSATTFDRLHVDIQNALYKTLVKKHGQKVVRYEHDYVDLKINQPNNITFIEIKTYPSPRRCIREALGQVLEYSCYPDKNLAHELLVVGQYPPRAEDKTYLRHIRKQYKLPLYYAQFLWQPRDLGEKF